MNNADRSDTQTSETRAAAAEARQNGLLLTAKDLAAELAIGVRTVWRMEKDGRLPRPVNPYGKLKRWRRQDVLEWLEKGCPVRKDSERRRK